MKAALTHIGTATLIIEYGGVRFITDPVFDPPTRYELGAITLESTEGPALGIDELPSIDVVLLSHDEHVDNLDATGRKLLVGRPTVTTQPAAVRLGGAAVGLGPWETTEVRVGSKVVAVTATPADHGDSGAAVVGFILQSDDEDQAVYISGDSVHAPQLDSIGSRFAIGLAVLHVGAAQIEALGDELITMDGAQAAALAGSLDADVVVPIHYESWRHFTESATDVARAFEEAGIAERLRWLTPGEPVAIETDDGRGDY